MDDTHEFTSENVYHNEEVGAIATPLVEKPDEIDETFAAASNAVLHRAAELARALIGTHQSAIAIVVQNDWKSVRKFFSLSQKYEQWANYNTAAVGHGIHGWLIRENKPVRFTQAELEAHSEWKSFGIELEKHPPMRGWLAAPLIDTDGVNWGLFQLSDKYEGDFSEEDEAQFIAFTALVSSHLEALWEVRNLQKQAAGLA